MDKTNYEQIFLKGVQPLLPKEEVIVIEIWNRSLAWKELWGEAFFERLLIICPPVIQLLGPGIDHALELFIGLFDLGIREIRPQHEEIAREGYRAMHPDHKREYQTKDEYLTHFIELGFCAVHWYYIIKSLFFGLQTHSPYLQESELDDLAEEENSAFWKWYCQFIAIPAIHTRNKIEDILNSDIVKIGIPNYWQKIASSQQERDGLAQKFYSSLLERYPDLCEYFKSTDMDHLAQHFFETINILVSIATTSGLEGIASLRPVLDSLGRFHRSALIPTWAYAPVCNHLLTSLSQQSPMSKELGQTFLYLYSLTSRIVNTPMLVEEKLMAKAEDYFVNIIGKEWGWSKELLDKRLLEVQTEVTQRGTYRLTSEEISYGCRVAWRNSSKCIGRVNWKSMLVRDCRHVVEPEKIFGECVEHLKIATGGENIVSVMSVFRELAPGERWGMRFWNSQFMRYAAWELEDGSIMGDPANVELTRAITRAFPDWKPNPDGSKTNFDLLPMVLEIPGSSPILYEWPEEVRYQVNIEHPDEPRFFEELGLKWCTVPTISNFAIDIGGIKFTCFPFNGWFADVEITRNLWERYKVGPKIAKIFGYDTSLNQSLWQDKAYTELTRAVLHSFAKSKFSMVDHHTVCAQFQTHVKREREEGREVSGQWSWTAGLVGPMANSAETGKSVWHHEMRDFVVYPQYAYQSDIFVVKAVENSEKKDENSAVTTEKVKIRIVILFGSETGTSEGVAQELARKLRALKPKLLSINSLLEEDNMRELTRATHIYVITSTFGSGNPPFNASEYAKIQFPSLVNISYAVLGLGSSIYPNFGSFAQRVDTDFAKYGAARTSSLVKADEISGQNETCKLWVDMMSKTILALAGIDPNTAVNSGSNKNSTPKFRLEELQDATPVNVLETGKLGTHLLAPVVQNVDLLNNGNFVKGHSTRHIIIDISQDPSLTYETGDHLSVLPENNQKEVKHLCSLFKIDPTSCFNAYQIEDDEEYPAPLPYKTPIRYRDALTYYYDLSIRAGMAEEILNLVYSLLTAEGKYENIQKKKESKQSENGVDKQKRAMIEEEKEEEIQKAIEQKKKVDEEIEKNQSLRKQIRDQLDIIDNLLQIEESKKKACPFAMTDNILSIREQLQKQLDAIPVPIAEISQKKSSLSRSRFAKSIQGISRSQKQFDWTEKGDGKITLKFLQKFVEEFEELPKDKKTELESKFSHRFLSVAELIEALPDSSTLHFGHILPILKRQKARYYSISSSSIQYPRQVHVTVGVVYSPTSTFRMRDGVCSNYLASLTNADKVLISLRASKFRAPSDPTAPMLCIGPGTGLAPMMGFLGDRQEFLKEGKKLGELHLYFGTRFRKDVLYPSLLDEYQKLGVISHMNFALSREENKKYVQHVISDQGELIWNVLNDPRAVYMICGDAKVADDVYETLLSIIQKYGKVSRVSAVRFIDKMRVEGRYQLDLFGVVMHLNKANKHFARKRNEAAQLWLESSKGTH